MTDKIEETQKRLYAISEHKGVPYGRVHHVFNAEEAYRQSVLKYRGFLTLSDAFKSFFLETVEIVDIALQSELKTPSSFIYLLFVTHLTHSFQSLCGAERIATSGYPFQGYTVLRNVFDDLVLVSAALQQITDFNSIHGIDPGKELQPDEARKLRKKTDWFVREIMTGKNSGFSQQIQDELKQWNDLFDFETHGGHLSRTRALGWLKNLGPLHVLPTFDELACTMFINRFCEIGWMAHRLIPATQPPDITFSNEWKNKWRIVDDAFEGMANSLTQELGKPIGAAIVAFVKAKFPFDEHSTFPQGEPHS